MNVAVLTSILKKLTERSLMYIILNFTLKEFGLVGVFKTFGLQYTANHTHKEYFYTRGSSVGIKPF